MHQTANNQASSLSNSEKSQYRSTGRKTYAFRCVDFALVREEEKVKKKAGKRRGRRPMRNGRRAPKRTTATYKRQYPVPSNPTLHAFEENGASLLIGRSAASQPIRKGARRFSTDPFPGSVANWSPSNLDIHVSGSR